MHSFVQIVYNVVYEVRTVLNKSCMQTHLFSFYCHRLDITCNMAHKCMLCYAMCAVCIIRCMHVVYHTECMSRNVFFNVFYNSYIYHYTVPWNNYLYGALYKNLLLLSVMLFSSFWSTVILPWPSPRSTQLFLTAWSVMGGLVYHRAIVTANLLL